MLITCPFCHQSYDVDQEFVGSSINCVKCGRDFVVVAAEPGSETVRKASSGKKKWGLISLIVIVGLLVLSGGLAAGYFWLQSEREVNNSQADPYKTAVKEFKKEFSAYVAEKVKNSKSFDLEWEYSCVNSDRDTFFGIIEICENNKKGESSKVVLLKVAGKRDGDKYEFRVLEFVGKISTYKDADWEKCCGIENERRGNFYTDRLKEITQKTEYVKHELDRIPVPEIVADNGDLPDSEELRRLETERLDYSVKVLEILNDAEDKLLTWTLSKSEERKFYSLLFPDNRTREAELEKTEALFAAQNAAVKKRISQFEENMKELKQRVAKTQLRAKVLAHLTVMTMVDEAIADYKRRHNKNLPSKSSVDRYEKLVRYHLGELVEAFNDIQESQRRIAAFGTPDSDRKRIELQELEKERNGYVEKFRGSYDELLKGISCGNEDDDRFLYGRGRQRGRRDDSVTAGHDPAKCGDSRLPPDHIKIDFRLQQTAKMRPFFSKDEESSESDLQSYLKENPEILKQVCWGMPDEIAVLVKNNDSTDPKGEDSAADREKEEKKKKICVSDIMKANSGKIKWRYRPGVGATCGHCNGVGELSDLVPNPKYNPNRNDSDPDIRVTYKCEFCRGAKRVTVFRSYKMAIIPADVLKAIRENLSTGGGVFCDFSIGEDFMKALADKKFYSARTLLLVKPTPFGDDYYYLGNHRYGNVEITVLTQQFGILTQVKLFTTDEMLANSLGELQLPVFAITVQSVNKLPFLKNGKLIFNPFKGGPERRRRRVVDDDSGAVDEGIPNVGHSKCNVSVIYAVHPNVLSVSYPKLGTSEFPCRWIHQP